jgi:hypothetical protein
MDDEVWARHASPYSVWSRFTALPLLILAFWSRLWIGWWAAFPVAAALLWTWLNPRIFQRPESTRNWASKATFGERVWLNRGKIPIPAHHRRAAAVLSSVSASGLIFVVWGVAVFAVWPALFGLALVYLAKLWFCDRMVWLYEDMKDADPEYRGWLRG